MPPLDATVRAAIADYAQSTDKPIGEVMRWLASRETVEIAADLLGLDAADGVRVNRRAVKTLAAVLRSHGYKDLTLFGSGVDEDGDG